MLRPSPNHGTPWLHDDDDDDDDDDELITGLVRKSHVLSPQLTHVTSRGRCSVKFHLDTCKTDRDVSPYINREQLL